MTRKALRRRPRLESLESIALLSGFSAALHHAVPALIATEPRSLTAAVLLGSFNGKWMRKTLTAPISFTGNGSVAGAAASLTGSLPHGVIAGGSATIKTSHGKITTHSTEKSGSAITFTVTGGTGKSEGASGTGTGNLSAPNSESLHGTFKVTIRVSIG
jgi:hypothetical protein